MEDPQTVALAGLEGLYQAGNKEKEGHTGLCGEKVNGAKACLCCQSPGQKCSCSQHPPFAAEVLGGCRSGRTGVPAVVEVSSW